MEDEWNKHDTNDQALRIFKIMEDENMNATQFSEAIGIRRAAMSHLVKRRNKPSADIITKIVKRFKTINPGWLLTGDGNMRIKSESGNGSNMGVNQPNINNYDEKSSNTMTMNHNFGKEPDLFNQHNNIGRSTTSPKNYSSEENIRTEILFTDEISDREEVKSSGNVDKVAEKEVVIYKERPVKTIDKLLIFYSDNTFESFIPEKH